MTAPTVLWLTDRSRYEEGLGRCLYARYLRYHYLGSGIQLLGESLPLLTGTLVHQPITTLLQGVKSLDKLPRDSVVQAAVLAAQEAYRQKVSDRGLLLGSGEDLDLVVREEELVLEGLTWAFVLTFLPWFHEHYRILAVEEEETYVVGCTCGLGEGIGEVEQHEARGCTGICWQSRPDILTEARVAHGQHAYWELKTVGMPNQAWVDEWETKIQFALGICGAERRHAIRIQENYVIGLVTGSRRASGPKDFETGNYTGPKHRDSPLAQAYWKADNPPVEPSDIAAVYQWVDEEGRNRRLGPKYQRTPLAVLEKTQGPLIAGLPYGEAWAKWIPRTVLAQQMRLIGPLNRQDVIIAQAWEEVAAHEHFWQWALAEIANPESGYYQKPHLLFPRSWQCRRYGADYECVMARICFQREGWEDPLGSGRYGRRTPHHQRELDQFVTQGWVDPQSVSREEAE